MNVRPGNADLAVRPAATYSLCGVEIEVTATAEVAALIGSRLRFLRSPVTKQASIFFDIRAGGKDGFAASPGGPGRPVYDAPHSQLSYFEGPDQLFIDCPGRLRMLCGPAAGLVQSAVLSEGLGSALAAYPFFTIPLMEVMKRFGCFPLHAGCLARDGCGVLLAGPSGSGKSTLTAALVVEGWDFLSDDTVFLKTQGGATSAWGFSDKIDCSDDTAAMFGELRHLVGEPTMVGRGKHPVDVEEVFGVLPVPVCRPHALVMPTISGERRSVLRAVSASYALRELVPNVLLTQRAATQAHLDMLAGLVSEVPCYSLSTGTDIVFASRCLQEILS
jgi:hypothetical protein